MAEARIGLIIPSSNLLTEPQFQRYAPAGVGVHVTRLRMTGKFHRPLRDLEAPIAEAAGALADAHCRLIVFHCTASSMEEGLEGEARVGRWIERASGCPAITTGTAIREALAALRIRKLVLITPYVATTNQHEVRYLSEAGFEVLHDVGLSLAGGAEYAGIPPERWVEIALEHARPGADGYLLSCTNTTMIEAIDALELRAGRPAVASNQAALWACLNRLGFTPPARGPGRLLAIAP